MTHDPTQVPTSIRPSEFNNEAPVAAPDNQATQAEQVEQARKSRRMKAMKSGRVVIHSSGTGIDCVVRSLSPSGARLSFAHPFDLPAQFELYLLTENVRVSASVAWCKGLDVGVKFDEPLDWLSKHVTAKRF